MAETFLPFKNFMRYSLVLYEFFMKAHIYQGIVLRIVPKLDHAINNSDWLGKETNNFSKVNTYLLIEASYSIRPAMGDILSQNFPRMIKPF